MTTGIGVSVIVPTRNRAHLLEDCLRSLAAQDYDGPFEVIVVDNGSSDATPEIVASWCRKDARFRTTREGRVGLSCAKNAGIRLATGDLLLFTDDDVVVGQGWIRAYVQFLAERDAEPVVAGGKIIPMPDDLGGWPGWMTDPALEDLGRLDYRRRGPLLEPWEYVWGANMAIPARIVERFGFWDESLGRRGDVRGTFEDTEYQDRVRAAGATVWFLPEAAVRHRVARRGVTPCRVLMTTFTRGRNDYWQGALRRSIDQRGLPQRPAWTGVAAFPGHLAAWLLWTIGFRLTSVDWMFRRAHQAAWRSGWVMEYLRDDRTSRLVTRAIGRLGAVVRSSALRLAPGSVAEAEEVLGLRPAR
jgi:glycosyltransferase involved in cell wall biosynthesis